MTTTASRPTLRTLANHLDLSVTTVSRALKNGPEVHIETRQRVQKAAKKLGYQPNARGVTLRTGATFTICATLSSWDASEVGDASAIALLQGMQKRLGNTAYRLTAMSQPVGQESLQSINQIVSQQLADGVIFDHTKPQDDRVRFLLEREFPFVSLGRTELFSEHPFIDTDMEAGAADGAQRLIDKGHESIALLNSGRGLLYAKFRERGFRASISKAGLLENRCPTYDCFGMEASDIRKMIADIVKQPGHPTAFMTENTQSTLGCVAGLSDVGVTIGKDVDVFGNDGSHLTSYIPVPIEYTYYPHVEIGAMLIDFILRRIQGESIDKLQRVLRPQIVYQD